MSPIDEGIDMIAGDSETPSISERLRAAEVELERERRRTTDELEAFDAFEDRLRSIETTTRPAQNAAPGRTVVAGSTTELLGLDCVRDAYEATVMSVPHYAEEYGDTYRRSVRSEFGPDLAAALTEGTHFHDRCKRAVLSATAEARSARESLLAEIDTERESLADVAASLSAIETELDELSAISFRTSSFGALDAYRSRLDVLEEKCETISARRQAAVFERRRTRWLPADVPDIGAYFYQDLETDYPAMSAVATLLDCIRGLRVRIERAMTFCHA